uniref:Fibronectin type-III domain-containing protein n=1 Tax=Oryzias latipes TaxID=8090 RepID=A0A3P9H4U7_ORYLA
MWNIDVMKLLLLCYACVPAGNGQVYFVSRNFYNVLHWEPVKPSFPGEEVLYSVQYLRDDEVLYRKKMECQNIAYLSCNLTAETPSLHDVRYRAKVFVNGSTIGITTKFMPLRDTVLGPPILSTHASKSALHVKVALPKGPNGVSTGDIITQSKTGFSRVTVLYILKITHPEWAAREMKNTTREFKIKLKNNITYCGYVVYNKSPEIGHASQNATFCVTLPEDPVVLWPWLLLSVAVVSGVAIILAVSMCNYVKGGKTKTMPQTLVHSSAPQKVQHYPDKNLIISKVEVNHPSDCGDQAKLHVPSVGGYSPQRISSNLFQGSANSSVGPNLAETTAQSAEIYGAVAAQVEPEKSDDFYQPGTEESAPEHSLLFRSRMSKRSRDKGGALQFTDMEASGNNQLVLDTVRNDNGQLVLSSLEFQFQTDCDDAGSLVNPETKPLLPYLIQCQDGASLESLQSIESSEGLDSGCEISTVNTPTSPYCNTHYTPDLSYFQRCQTTCTVFESRYKQNWMP